MIKIFYGDDRVSAKKEIEKILGAGYEVIDGDKIDEMDLPSIFMGASLFADSRKILIRDLSQNTGTFSKLPDYLGTPHQVILFETKLDKRSTTYKAIKNDIEIKEFSLPANANFSVVFNIYKVAKTDGKKAVSMLSDIKQTEDPIMFFGLLVSQAIKDFSAKQGTKEKRVLKELSKVDIQMKTTSMQPWSLIESFLLQVSSLR